MIIIDDIRDIPATNGRTLVAEVELPNGEKLDIETNRGFNFVTVLSRNGVKDEPEFHRHSEDVLEEVAHLVDEFDNDDAQVKITNHKRGFFYDFDEEYL